MSEQNKELESAKREVLGRMAGCPLPNCSACRSNRESLEKLVRVAQANPDADPTVRPIQ